MNQKALEQILKQLTKGKSVGVTGMIVLVLILGVAAFTSNNPPQEPIPTSTTSTQAESSHPALPDGVYEVSRVVDGDTIVVTNGQDEVKVRLIGVNTPETVDPRKPVECFGQEASNKLKELIEGKEVTLLEDPTQENFDRYNRALRYVLTPDEIDAGMQLIYDGYAYEYTYKTPYERQAEYQAAQDNARDYARGLWEEGVCENEE